MPNPINFATALRFLEELSQNNNKAWFEAHRPDYQAARSTFEQFVNDLIDEFRVSDHLQDLTAKDCVARIYRDIRFSKDKSPYKTNLAAMIAPGGWRSTALGYYVSIGPLGQSMVAGGLYSPTTEQLSRFREAIVDDASGFKEIIQAKEFIEAFGEIEGERLKTAPRGYDRDHPEIDLLRLKQITAVHRFTEREVREDDFKRQVVSLCRAMKPFLSYLNVTLL